MNQDGEENVSQLQTSPAHHSWTAAGLRLQGTLKQSGSESLQARAQCDMERVDVRRA